MITMTRLTPTRFIVMAMVTWACADLPPSRANSGVDWFTIDGGGGTSGGQFSLGGTIGQVDAGTMSGGNFTLEGGFWLFLGDDEKSPRLRIMVTSANVRIAWPNPSTGFQLQSTAGLVATNSTAWNDEMQAPVVVGNEKQISINPGSGHRFFRLRR